MSEKLTGIVAAAAGVAETEAAELITTDEGLETLKSKITAKLADAKTNEGKRVLKDTRKAVEDALKAAGVTADAFQEDRGFRENVAAAVASIKSSVVAESAKDLTDAQILDLPAVIALKNQLTLDTERKVSAAKKEAEDGLKKKVEDFRKEQNAVGVRAWAEKQADELKPNFSTIPSVAAAQREDYIQKLMNAGTYQKEGEAYVLVDDKGEIIKDPMQNPVKPEAKAREIAEKFYGLPASTDRSSTGLSQAEIEANRLAGEYQGPKTQADYEKALFATAPGEARAKLTEDWNKFKETQTAA